jgi:hypothetical protein
MKNYNLCIIHPKYLDNFALKQCWQDAIEIKNIIVTKRSNEITRQFHKGHELEQVKSYLLFLYLEGVVRGLDFDPLEIDKKVLKFSSAISEVPLIETSKTQIKKQRLSFLGELKKRDSLRFAKLKEVSQFEHHPSFYNNER